MDTGYFIFLGFPFRSSDSLCIVYLKSFYLFTGEPDLDTIPHFYTVRLLYLFSVYFHLSRTQPLIYTPKWCFREVFLEEFIDPLVSI